MNAQVEAKRDERICGISRFDELLPIGTCATLACLWEVTAAKPGNVCRSADFDDVTFPEFVTSAAVIGPAMEAAEGNPLGQTILSAIRATRRAVASNTNLGTVLLIAPLASVPREVSLAEGVERVLSETTSADTAGVYEAIRLAGAGGLGRVPEADVLADTPPDLPLVEVMRLAAHRDAVARQYVVGFRDVFATAELLAERISGIGRLEEAIVRVHVERMAAEPDSLIARKCGPQVAGEAQARAARVLAAEAAGEEASHCGLAELDFWLRSDGHRRNPGTTADFIAAGLFVLLRDGRIGWGRVSG